MVLTRKHSTEIREEQESVEGGFATLAVPRAAGLVPYCVNRRAVGAGARDVEAIVFGRCGQFPIRCQDGVRSSKPSPAPRTTRLRAKAAAQCLGLSDLATFLDPGEVHNEVTVGGGLSLDGDHGRPTRLFHAPLSAFPTM